MTAGIRNTSCISPFGPHFVRSNPIQSDLARISHQMDEPSLDL